MSDRNVYTVADFLDELMEAIDKPDPKKAILFLMSQRRPLLRTIDRDCERIAEIRKLVGGMP